MTFESLMNSAVILKLQSRYQAMPEKDQRIVNVLAIVSVFVLVVFGLIIPVTNYKNTAQISYKTNLESYKFMLENKETFNSAIQRQSIRDSGQSLLGLANSSSKEFGLVFKRYEPVGENGLGLWLEEVSFNSVVQWLEKVDKKYSIQVTEIVVDRQSLKGKVNVRLELQG